MKKIAFHLRKLADLFDPSVKPSPVPMTIELNFDTSQALKALAECESIARRTVATLDEALAKRIYRRSEPPVVGRANSEGIIAR